MNDTIIKLGLESGMLNYVDNETPRHYFLSGHADEQDLSKFAELIIRECAACCGSQTDMRNIRNRFGLPVESNIKYSSPDRDASVNSQYKINSGK